jgi:hypothetical protein
MILVPFILSGATSEFSADQAKRVDVVLKRIAQKKRLTFSQDELNSYLNLVYAKYYAPEVKYIKLKLGKNNSADGEMKIKLAGKQYDQVPAFLRDIQVEFSGKIECENNRMRYLFDDLKINGTKFSPELLDEAFGAAQGGTKIKKSMFDWFDLFPGLKKVVLDYKKITIFY